MTNTVILRKNAVVLPCGHRNRFVRRRDIPLVVGFINFETGEEREELAKPQRCFHCGNTTKKGTLVKREEH